MATNRAISTKNRRKDISNNQSNLKKCFQALVDRKQLNIDWDVLLFLLKYELQVDLDSLAPDLIKVLPYMVVVFIKNWPGWQKSKEYYSGKLKYREWFFKFKRYVIVRVNYLIKSGYKNVLDEIQKEKLERNMISFNARGLINKGSQTDHAAPKDISSFTISIQCPPNSLGSFVFCGKDDDIIVNKENEYINPLKKIQLDATWSEMTIADLVNWPHVGIEFISTELSFKRYNCSEYRRFINLITCPLSVEKSGVIEEINIINPNLPRSCYTLNRLQSYAQQYLDVLQKFDNLSQSKLEVIKTVLEEFLKDIEEINVHNTIASNTSVLFNIGKSTFFRRKLNKSKNRHTGICTEVCYCETVIPKMEIHLNFFKAVQDSTTDGVTFQYLNALNTLVEEKNKAYAIHEPIILFKCLFCDVTYDNHETLSKHFQTMHGVEPNLVCPLCLKSASVNVLAKVRWTHVCSGKT